MLIGKSALVTGGNSGIGRATAQQLASLGAHVVVSGRDEARGRQVVDGIRANGGGADFIASDLFDEASARSLAIEAVALGFGHIDILVNNAGVFPSVATHETSEADFDAVYDINVKVPFFLVAELAPAMAARGSGAIINVASITAHFGSPLGALYGSSKAAMILLTKAWAAEYGPMGVRVNAVSPGATRTPGTLSDTHLLDAFALTTPSRRVGQPEEVADAITWLAGSSASWVHGAVVPVDGGRLAI